MDRCTIATDPLLKFNALTHEPFPDGAKCVGNTRGSYSVGGMNLDFSMCFFGHPIPNPSARYLLRTPSRCRLNPAVGNPIVKLTRETPIADRWIK